MARQVFISYATEDAAIAAIISEALEERGFSCFLARRDIRPGEDWPTRIEEALTNSRIVVVVISGRTERSRWVPLEVQRAVSLEREIIPVRWEEVEPAGSLSFLLGGRSWLDAFRRPREKRIEELCRSVHSLIGESARPEREEIPGWIAGLNSLFEGEAEVICRCSVEPQVEVVGQVELAPDVHWAARKYREGPGKVRRPDDRCAILVDDLRPDREPVRLSARSLDFASVCALRERKEKPKLLSASGTVICSASKEVILHSRSMSSLTFAGYLHTIGGMYLATDDPRAGGDRGGLRNTLEREVYEETEMTLPQDQSPPMIMAKEPSTGFVQLVFLGFDVSRASLGRMRDSWEGGPVRVRFDHLADVLLRSKWVPTGRAHVLAWLALGAPGADPDVRFGRLTAHELFQQVVCELSRRRPPPG